MAHSNRFHDDNAATHSAMQKSRDAAAATIEAHGNDRVSTEAAAILLASGACLALTCIADALCQIDEKLHDLIEKKE